MPKKANTILVVDDEPNIRRVLEAVLSRDGYTVLTAENGRKASEVLASQKGIDLLITDLIMPDINGIELLSAARKIDPNIAVVMITAHGSIKSAVDAMRLGAFDYITKPFDLDEIKLVAKNAIERRQLQTPKLGRRSKRAVSQNMNNMVGSSASMKDIINMVDRVKDSRASVLIRGESGTGKELVAKALHYSSIRVEKPFVAVACVALPEQLLQSELFGHEKGSFTSAISQKKGRFELANNGTLFLDEIGDIPHAVQMMLLRVIQEREFERVGGTETIKTDVRLVTATNQNLEKLVDEGKFREDLFYRLQVITLVVPPLRERPEDIKTLSEHFIEKYSQENGKRVTGINKAAISAMLKYRWPGNVRELENAMERAVVLADPGVVSISPDLLPPCVLAEP